MASTILECVTRICLLGGVATMQFTILMGIRKDLLSSVITISNSISIEQTKMIFFEFSNTPNTNLCSRQVEKQDHYHA